MSISRNEIITVSDITSSLSDNAALANQGLTAANLSLNYLKGNEYIPLSDLASPIGLRVEGGVHLL